MVEAYLASVMKIRRRARKARQFWTLWLEPQEGGHRGLSQALVEKISMKRVLVDVNVIRDVLLDRSPHAVASRAIWAAIELRWLRAFSAHGVTTLDYLMRKELGAAGSRRALRYFYVFSRWPALITPSSKVRSMLTAHFEDSVTAAVVGCPVRSDCDSRPQGVSCVPGSFLYA